MNRRDLILRLRAVVARRRVERELDDELAFHLERETRKHVAAGLSPAEARARALARFGSVPLAADQCRDARGIGLLDDFARDIAYALRTFRRAPLAAVTIVATVALGLGLVTAVFAVYDVFLLRADAVQNPGQLFAVAIGARSVPDNPSTLVFTRQDYEALRRETAVFTDAVAIADYAGPFEGHLTRSARVSGNFFLMLGGPRGAGAVVASRGRRGGRRAAGDRAQSFGMAKAVPE